MRVVGIRAGSKQCPQPRERVKKFCVFWLKAPKRTKNPFYFPCEGDHVSRVSRIPILRIRCTSGSQFNWGKNPGENPGENPDENPGENPVKKLQ